MPPFLANLRPRSLPRTKQHVPEQSGNIARERPRSQFLHDHSSSFLATFRPRSPDNNNNNSNSNNNNFPASRSNNNNDIPPFDSQATPAAFSANFRPRSHSSQEGARPNSRLYHSKNNSSQESSFSRLSLNGLLFLRPRSSSSSSHPKKNKHSNHNPASSSCTNASKSKPPQSTRPQRPLSHTNSQESNCTFSSLSSSSSTTFATSTFRPHPQHNNINTSGLEARSQTDSQEYFSSPSSSSTIKIARSQDSTQETPQNTCSTNNTSTSYTDRPRSPINAPKMPFLSNLRTRACTDEESDKRGSSVPAKPRFATDIPPTTRKSSGLGELPRRRSRRGMRRGGNINVTSTHKSDGKYNISSTTTDSAQIERAHMARVQVNAASVLKRAIKREYVKRNILQRLEELDALVQYAEQDLRSIPVMSKRILGIQTVNNIVVEKQIQAASYLYALRKKPEMPAVKKARDVMNGAACLLENQNIIVICNEENNTKTSVALRLAEMERALCVCANDLAEIPHKSCTVREQVLELLVLTTRKRAEIEIKAASSNNSNNHNHNYTARSTHESFTSQDELFQAFKSPSHTPAKRQEHNNANGSPTCVRDGIIAASSSSSDHENDANDLDIKAEEICTAAEDNYNNNYIACAEGGEIRNKEEKNNNAAVAVPISRSWKMKKVGTPTKALAYLARLRIIEREMFSSSTSTTCVSLQIFDRLATEARGLRRNICDVYYGLNDITTSINTASRVGAQVIIEEEEVWERKVRTGRRNAAISTLKRSVALWRAEYVTGVRESLERISGIVEAVVNNNNNYNRGLEQLIEEYHEHPAAVVRRKATWARNIVAQKERSMARIKELRQIEKDAQVMRREKAAAENEADQYLHWWTDGGRKCGRLDSLLNSLHTILPQWNSNSEQDNNINNDVKKMYRKALLLVHPDRVMAKSKHHHPHPLDQVLAHKIFVELQQAYDIYVAETKKDLQNNNIVNRSHALQQTTT